MVNNMGIWFESPELEDKNKWCDMDYIASWIRSKNYNIKTTIDNLINMILEGYYETDEVKKLGYYAVKDDRHYPVNLMINIKDISIYVEDNGDLKEFDNYH